jgi:quinol monooxygenase YgiN
MFGTVARLQLKPGHQQALMDLQNTWDDTRDPAAVGAVAVYVFQSERDANECSLVAIFRDRDAYFANANDPEQDRWYRQMREHLESDPEWVDGEVVMSQTF